MMADYPKFVKWSNADRVYVGFCPDLFIGGVCHGENENRVYAELCRLISEEMESLSS